MSLNLIRASDGTGEAVRASVTAIRAPGSTTINVDAITNWPATFVATTGDLLASGALDPATVLVFKGSISGSTIVIDTIAPGYTDEGSGVGDVVLLKPSTLWADNVRDTLAVSLDDDGTLKAGAVDVPAVLTDNVVTTSKLADLSVTSRKTTALTYQASVTTSGTVTSASYANFPTNRCFVDVVTTLANAKVRVDFSADTAYAGATGSAYMRFAFTNANTGNATYERRAQNSDASQRIPVTYSEILTLATAGTTRIEVQVRGSSTAACAADFVILTAQVLQG